MFALVDVNNMYVSCERVFKPSLIGRPVVVLSSNDGACIARSNEAKDLGVKMAQPWFEVRHLERSAGLIAQSANFELYGDMSSRMMALAAQYAPRQEIYSIDECFLDFEGVRGDLIDTGRHLRAAVLQCTGLPTSVGFGPTKTLAKLANHVAKTEDRKPGTYPAHVARVCDFGCMSQSQLDDILRRTDVGSVWGVGRKTTARLNEGSIRTVLDLVNADVATLRRQFNVLLEKTVFELRGTSCLDVDDAPAPNQQIMASRSFGEPATDITALSEIVSGFTTRVAAKLRAQHSLAAAVRVFITTSPHRRQDAQHSPSITMPLVRPTSDTRALIAAALSALERMFRPGHNYVKAGVMLVDLCDEGQAQGELDLFAEPVGPSALSTEAGARATAANARLMNAVDALNLKFGLGAVGVASGLQRAQGAQRHASRQERRSPRYTTRLEEIATVRA
ncbi:Y-family DNA polymerase [Rhizobacter sp. LjRoot28]|uniref:Y-family DNA polymerase n=1 Tax=Rhizobacter sp. LjRoot28 TaxID=3342309 RepID=UPI003ECFEAC9